MLEKHFVALLLIASIVSASWIAYFYVTWSLSFGLVQSNFHFAGGFTNVTIGQDAIFGFSLYNQGKVAATLEKADVLSDSGVQVVEICFVKYANASEANEILGLLPGTPTNNGWLVYSLKGYQIQPHSVQQGAVWFQVASEGNHTIRAVQFTYSCLGWSHECTYTYDSLWVYGS